MVERKTLVQEASHLSQANETASQIQSSANVELDDGNKMNYLTPVVVNIHQKLFVNLCAVFVDIRHPSPGIAAFQALVDRDVDLIGKVLISLKVTTDNRVANELLDYHIDQAIKFCMDCGYTYVKDLSRT